MDDFLLYAILAGVGVAVVMGPLGVFVVWRRMAYFGDSVAHSALLGVALGFLLDIGLGVTTTLVCVSMALALLLLRRQRKLADDTLLGILSHSALAFGLIAVSFAAHLRVDLIGYLFGDILAVSETDLLWIYGGGALVLIVLWRLWTSMVAITVNEDLARVDGFNVARTQLIFMLMIALVIAVAMKVVGILMVTSLLIIPAAAARRFARTPEQMAIYAIVIGCVSVAIGLGGSFTADLPSGPAIVAGAALLFLISILIPGGGSRKVA